MDLEKRRYNLYPRYYRNRLPMEVGVSFNSKRPEDIGGTMTYTLKDIVKALSRWIHYSPVRSAVLGDDAIISGRNNADFEEVVQGAVDATNIINSLKYADLRLILVYKAIGYANWEIALIFGISERTVNNRIKSIRIFLRRVGG